MLSIVFELLGLSAVVDGTYLLAGRGIALLVAGVALLFVGYATDGVQIRVTHPRFWRPLMDRWRRDRQANRRAKREPRRA